MADERVAAHLPRGQDAERERRLSFAIGAGLPLVTVAAAAIVGALLGLATALLTLAAGVLIGAIGLFWRSLRTLSGDAPLAPELEEIELGSHGASALVTRKKMLLRALKDLENERAIGKLEDDDYEQVSATYRDELKAVLKRIDVHLTPYRSKAEEAARAHLEKSGLAEAAAPMPGGETGARADASGRVRCPTCQASNEADAKFCKECAAKLAAPSTEIVAAALGAGSQDA